MRKSGTSEGKLAEFLCRQGLSFSCRWTIFVQRADYKAKARALARAW